MSSRILIIDDEPALMTALRDYLEQRGFICECVAEVAEAQALLANVQFDVVLTDIYISPLQEADGLRVLSFIRERALDVRPVVMTAHSTPELKAEALRLGAAVVLQKPTSLAVLAAALTAAAEVPA
jgi:DNA-binding NtrC family response regulator